MERLQKEWGRITIYGDELIFENSGKFFTLIGVVSVMTTEYKFNTTDSPDSKLINDFVDEMPFDVHARGKSLRDKTFLKICCNKKALLASGIKRSE